MVIDIHDPMAASDIAWAERARPTPLGATTPPNAGAGESRSGRDGAPTDLARRFVEGLLRQAPPAGRPRGGAEGTTGGAVDWPSAVAAGRGAASRHEAEGRVVLAALGLTTGAVPARPGAGPGPSIRVGPAAGPPSTTVPGGSSHAVVVVPPPAPTPSRAAAPGAPRAGAASDAVDSGAPGRPRGWQRLQRREQLATAFGWVRNVGAIVILFAGWQVWGTSISQRQAQQSLGSDFRAAAGHHTAASGTEPLIAAGSRIAQPQDGSVVARLQIPAIGVDQYVVQGTAEGDLAKGPGHYQGTAMPGQGGNVAIAGHRTTYGAPFNNLDQLELGDPVVLTADSGRRFEYVVSQRPQAVAPSDVSVLRFFGDNRLTLTTCNPRFSASQRLVVVATLRTPVAQAPGAVGHQRASTHPGGGGSVGWNLVYLPAALAVLAVMVLLGVMNRRACTYYGRRARWIVLVPIWVAVTYILFGLLTSLLPATL